MEQNGFRVPGGGGTSGDGLGGVGKFLGNFWGILESPEDHRVVR